MAADGVTGYLRGVCDPAAAGQANGAAMDREV